MPPLPAWLPIGPHFDARLAALLNTADFVARETEIEIVRQTGR